MMIYHSKSKRANKLQKLQLENRLVRKYLIGLYLINKPLDMTDERQITERIFAILGDYNSKDPRFTFISAVIRHVITYNHTEGGIDYLAYITQSKKKDVTPMILAAKNHVNPEPTLEEVLTKTYDNRAKTTKRKNPNK